MATLGLGLGQDAFTISSRVYGGGGVPGAAGVRAMTAVANSPGVLQVLDVVSEVGSSLFIFLSLGRESRRTR